MTLIQKLSISLIIFANMASTAFAQTDTGTETAPNLIVYYFTKDGAIAKTRENAEYYRKLLQVNDDGSHLIQDFYSATDTKQVDPIIMLDPNELDSWEPKSLKGPFIFWHENGQKQAEGELPDGPITSWHDNGQKEIEGHYKDSMLEGPLSSWYDNGQKQAQGQMHKDEMHGIWTLWDKDGHETQEDFSTP